MCYSAQIRAEYRKYERSLGASIDIRQYVRFFWERRRDGTWRRIPKGMKRGFAEPRNAAERELQELVAAGDAECARGLEAELFRQKRRLADAERALATATTRKALNEQRIAGAKLDAAQRALADLRRSEPLARDARIYPGQFAPVMIVQDGVRKLVPMRYQCRLPGWNATTERKYPGTYNARRDNLGKAWRQLFGRRHGIMVVEAFYENVPRHKAEHRELAPGEAEQNLVLEFRPDPPHDMLVACLWNHDPGAPDGSGELYSFAAITDEPPAEIAAAGHDRCIIPIKPAHLDAWLAPEPGRLETLQAILDDRDQPYYEHRLAA